MTDTELSERIASIREVADRSKPCGCGKIGCTDTFGTERFGRMETEFLNRLDAEGDDPMKVAADLIAEADAENLAAFVTNSPKGIFRALCYYRLALVAYDVGRLRA